MYVYVSDRWNIILKTNKRQTKLRGKYREFNVNYWENENLIFEWWQVIKYENSKQYIEDSNRYHLSKELEEEKRKNKDLVKIANAKVTKELELEERNLEANEYQRKVYMLRNMRWLQQ